MSEWTTPRQALRDFDKEGLTEALVGGCNYSKARTALENLKMLLEYESDAAHMASAASVKEEIPGLERAVQILTNILKRKSDVTR